jgi:membrane-associated phospholipid phosphatase
LNPEPDNSAKKFARFISILLVPPSFTIIVFTIFAFTLETETIKIIVTILTALIFGFISPIILFFILRKKGKLKDIDASVKEERTFPFLMAILFYLAGLIVLIIFNVNIISIAFWFCYISNTLLTILINKYWKISAHSMGAAGALSAIFYVFGLPVLFFSLLVLVLGWARIYQKMHTLSQVIAGIILAFVSVYVQINIIVNIFGK